MSDKRHTDEEQNSETDNSEWRMKMSNKWYGSINNRLEENRQFCETIEVGTGVTEYSWSDREAYEVVAVKDQKHCTIRRYDHRPAGEPMSNDWELISNPDNPTIDLVKRGNYWYKAVTATREHAESDDIHVSLWLCQNGFDREKILAKGQQTKYHKMNISFGVADYYYDYSF